MTTSITYILLAHDFGLKKKIGQKSVFDIYLITPDLSCIVWAPGLMSLYVEGGGVNAFVFGKTSLFFFKHKDIYCIVFALWLT